MDELFYTKECESLSCSHELNLIISAKDLLSRKPQNENRLIRELDGYIQNSLSSDFRSLFSRTAKFHRISGLFRSRVLFAYMRSVGEIPPYAEFVRTMCGDGSPFCGESYYSRHRQALALLKLCAPSCKEYYSDFSEYSLRKIICATRNFSEEDLKKFLIKLSNECQEPRKPTGLALEDAIARILHLHFQDIANTPKQTANTKLSRIPGQINRCRITLCKILKSAEKIHAKDPEKGKIIARIQRQIDALIGEIEELSGVMKTWETGALDASSHGKAGGENV